MNRVEGYEKYVWPILEKTDPNWSHEMAIALLKKAQEYPWLLGKRFESERLQIEVAGITFDNPLLLAAGFDKDGRVVDAMYRLGFASVVVGSVLQYSQMGNTKPTVFRPE